MDSDRQIIERILKGDGALFEGLVKKYMPRLLGFLCRMGLSSHDAEDLAQDTLVKAYKNLYRYDGCWEFSTWLYKIASNTCKDFLRKHRQPAAELDENIPSADSSGNPLERTLLQQDIQSLLQVLKPDVRSMLLLHYYSGLTLQEIGRLYKLSPSAVKMKLFRAREKLMKSELSERMAVIP